MLSKPRRKYWYKYHWGECPVCGHDLSYKERIYGRKPGRTKRHVYIPYNQSFDGCMY